MIETTTQLDESNMSCTVSCKTKEGANDPKNLCSVSSVASQAPEYWSSGMISTGIQSPFSSPAAARFAIIIRDWWKPH